MAQASTGRLRIFVLPMKCHIKLFACYPLVPVAAAIGGLAVEAHGFYKCLSITVLAAYYALLMSSLWECSRVENWAGRMYLLAWLSVCLHVILAVPLMFSAGTGWQDVVFGGVLLTILVVYICCSLAGADMARRLGSWGQAATQVLWPASLLAFPLVESVPGLSDRFSQLLFLPVIGFGIQGLQALLLAFTLHVPVGEPFLPESAPEIGWEVFSD